MSTALRTGSADVVDVGARTFYDPIRGRQVIWVFEGDINQIEAKRLTLGSHVRYDIDDSQAPVYRLTAYAPDETDTPVFELLANLHEKDIYEHEAFSGVTNENVAAIVTWSRRPSTTLTLTGDATQQALATKLKDLVLRGTKKYATEDYVLRYTVTATLQVELNLAYQGTNQLYTTTQMLAELTGTPAGIIASIGNIPAKTHSSSAYVWRWLKRAPTTRQTQWGKVVITGEYWLDLWNSDVHALMT